MVFNDSCTFDPKLKRELAILDTLIAIILVALCIVSLLAYNFYKEELNREILTYGRFGLIFVTSILEFVPNFLNPYLVLLVGFASGISLFLAVILTCLGSTIGSTLGYELGRKYGWRFVCPLFQEKTLGKILVFWDKHGKWFVAVSALTPLPYVPLVFGALGMKRKDFWIYGVLFRIASFLVVGLGLYLGFIH